MSKGNLNFVYTQRNKQLVIQILLFLKWKFALITLGCLAKGKKISAFLPVDNQLA